MDFIARSHFDGLVPRAFTGVDVSEVLLRHVTLRDENPTRPACLDTCGRRFVEWQLPDHQGDDTHH